MTRDGRDQPFDVAADDGEGTRVDGAEVDAAAEASHVHRLDPDEPPTVGVVRTVAAATGREIDALPPLYGAIDTDALALLVDRRDPDVGGRAVRVTFEYAGTTVTVVSTGRIYVYP